MPGEGQPNFFLKPYTGIIPAMWGLPPGVATMVETALSWPRYLHQKGIPTTVFLLSERDRIKGDAAANLGLLDAMGVPVVELTDIADFDAHKALITGQRTWIDAILGTGLSSDVRGYFRAAIDFINRQGRPVFAVDIASGLNADTGQVCGTCIQAAATATFGFAKVGHLCFPGRTLTGHLKVIEIGIPPHVAVEVGCRQHLITPGSLKNRFPNRSATAHKGQTGHLLVLAGSPGKTGAAAMAAGAAMRAGAGLVTLGIPKSLNPLLETMVTEAMTVGLPETADGALDETAWETIVSLLKDKRCLAMGPGTGTHRSTGRLMGRLVRESRVPIIIDADGLNLIASDPAILANRQSPIVLTPHPGEMARLSGCSTADIQNDRIGHARSFARRHGVHLVLKGAATIVAQPDGIVFVNATGNPGMASGGMGDVLTGLIAGLITQGMEVSAAARAGVLLHGSAADRIAAQRAPVGYLATEVMDAIPQALGDRLCADDNLPFPGLDRLAYPTDPV